MSNEEQNPQQDGKPDVELVVHHEKGPSVHRNTIKLGFVARVGRAYGIWWDMINTGVVVAILAAVFVAFSVMMISGRMDQLPWQDTVWGQFRETVPENKQSEIGLGMLSITLSAASAAALYLIRIGTARWAMNRRIGQIHLFFAEALLERCSQDCCSPEKIRGVFEGFLDASMHVFEQISETHPKAQVFFEHARMKTHILLNESSVNVHEARGVAIDLLVAALICRKQVTLPGSVGKLEEEVLERLGNS